MKLIFKNKKKDYLLIKVEKSEGIFCRVFFVSLILK